MTTPWLHNWGGEKPHGTPAKYKNGCRCEECRAGNAERAREARARQRALLPEEIPSSVHGTLNGYRNYRCRCAECKAANSENKRREYAELKAIREQFNQRPSQSA